MKLVRHCRACGNSFRPRPQNPNQHFCSELACQRERRRQWQRQRLQSDADYRDNQARAQANWRASHPTYWRQYRATHPVYLDRNRSMQRQRNACRRVRPIANMDASQVYGPLQSGFYVLQRVRETSIAKMNAYVVRIDVVSGPARGLRDCKQMT